MARLHTTGFELNSVTQGVEEITTVVGSPTISSTTFRTGSYSLHINPSNAAQFIRYQLYSSNTPSILYFRGYVRIHAYPAADRAIIDFVNISGPSGIVAFKVSSTGVAKLYNDNNLTQIGSNGPTLSLDTWYRIEVKCDTTSAPSVTAEAKVNGTAFASGTVSIANIGGNGSIDLGAADALATDEFFWDDIGINDNTGSYQNGYPGDANVIYIRPAGAGDNTGLTKGGSSPAATNWQSVNETTPDDGVTYVSANTAVIDDYTLSSNSIGTYDTINCIQLGARYAGAGASSNAPFFTRFKVASGETVSESSSITPSSTSYTTNTNATPFLYTQTLYNKPGTSTNFVNKDLTNGQIGVRATSGTNAAIVSDLWLVVDYTPNPSNASLTNVTSMTNITSITI